MSAEANAQVAREIFASFAERDPMRLRELFADDAVWTVPGESIVAGTYRGRTEIFRFLSSLRRLTDGSYRSRLIDVLASDERAAALYRATGSREGRELDIDQVLLFTLRGGKVADVTALPSDPLAFERFWAQS